MVDRLAGEFERACRVDRFFLSLSQCEITAPTTQKPQPDSIDFESSGGAFQRSITQEIAGASAVKRRIPTGSSACCNSGV